MAMRGESGRQRAPLPPLRRVPRDPQSARKAEQELERLRKELKALKQGNPHAGSVPPGPGGLTALPGVPLAAPGTAVAPFAIAAPGGSSLQSVMITVSGVTDSGGGVHVRS